MEHIELFFKSIFIDNMVFATFLGMCSYLAVSKKLATAVGLGAAVIFVLAVTVPLNWLLDQYILKDGALAWLGPEYVVYDWFYKSNKNETQENIEEVINKYKDVEWELKENFHMSLNILSDETINRLKEREGGIEKKGLEGDLERHQTQSDLIKSQGISKEPIILLELLNGKYELVEGWHRTIQIFKLYPEGFEYPNVWIGKSTDGTDISIYI